MGSNKGQTQESITIFHDYSSVFHKNIDRLSPEIKLKMGGNRPRKEYQPQKNGQQTTTDPG
uniref:Uncharacterized protein n=1 Tax=Oryza sativa subsp. japonica TaxID=39947 RepID=Q6ZDL5_ORYSJ|nr:hypothetical protein [Oryza sativa Japonica Group]